jgi:hypothetical protein
VPIGIPAQFLTDVMAHWKPTDSGWARLCSLTMEYWTAEGYPYDWGHIVEETIGEFVVWRIVPVAIWEPVATTCSRWLPPIAELLPCLHGEVRNALAAKVPRGVSLTGLFGQGRLCPHTLLTFLVSKPHHIDGARRWLAEDFVGDLLPKLLPRLEVQVGKILCPPT